jgi:hypothetical protein
MLLRAAIAFGPWGLALAGAGLAAFALYENWDTIGPLLGDAVSRAGDYLLKFSETDWLAKGQEIGTMITNWLNTIDWAAIGTWITTFSNNIANQFSNIDFFKSSSSVGDMIINWINRIDWGAVGSTLWSILLAVGTIMSAAILFIGGLAWKLLTSALGGAWNAIKSMASAAWEGIKSSAISAINLIINSINALLLKVKDATFGMVNLGSINPISVGSGSKRAVASAAVGRGSSGQAPLQGEVNINWRDSSGRTVRRTPVLINNGPRTPRSNFVMAR